MNSRLNMKNEPVCKFGPGGKFVSVWPPEAPMSIEVSSNRLTRLLATMSEIITALLGSEFGVTSDSHPDIERSMDWILHRKGRLEYAVENNKVPKSANPTAATIVKSNRLLSDEPMLFADDCRISFRAADKPSHSLRAHRRASKKKPDFSCAGQGSLFEADLQIARTA